MSLHYPRVSRIHSVHPAAAQATTLLVAARRRPDPSRVEAGGTAVDGEGRTATVGSRALRLTFMEFEFLAHLVAHPLRVYTRRQLLHLVWAQEPFGDSRTVDVHIARLRRKLGPEHRDRISTVRQVGYRFDPRGAGTASS
ncbi:winged helix-turn-helix domain-containing protein [Kitasatospora herbaricolor]|uniref:winged helix-turn-helix domain-containing protein n=1 Tax=Kitasatospora herbaricolor TaxID=68217 RepID=UPI0039A5EA75